MKKLLAALAIIVPVTLVGCGGVATSPVSGKVTYKGEPVSGATVIFSPAGEEAKTATGITAEDGTFQLTTASKDDGAVVGSYKVAITKSVTTGAELTPDEAHAQAEAGKKVSSPKRKNMLPKKYADSNSSGLTANVVAGSNDFTFELKDK